MAETVYNSKNTLTVGAVSFTSVSAPTITASGTPSAAANVLTVIGSSTTGNVMQFSNSAGGNFILTSAGRIGIGTAAPSQQLHIGSGNVYVQATTASVTTGVYAAVATNSSIAASSTDGITWTQRTMPTSAAWWPVTVNPNTGVFVAIADQTSIAASSTDGITWTQRTMSSSNFWRGVTVNPTTGVFVAVSGGGGTIAASSTNGITWTDRTIIGGDYNTVTVNPTTGVFVAISWGGQVAASSTDGITWTQRNLPSVAQWNCIAVNSSTGVFVAIAFGQTIAASSTNGTTWTARTLPSAGWRSVTCNPTTGIFAAVADGPTTIAASSTDGITWTQRAMPVSASWRSVTVSTTTGVFSAVATSSSIAASSTDGITWTQQTLPVSTNWYGVTAGSATTTIQTAGYLGLGTATPAYQLDLSLDSARKLTTTTWLTGSDSRIKTDVESANLQTCYDVVKSVDLKYFKWNFPEGIVPDDRHSLGFIAQEVKSVFPNAVSASNSYGYEDFLSLNVDQIDKALFGAVKYLSAKVEALEQSLATASVPEDPEPVVEVVEVPEPVVEAVEAPETASVPEVPEPVVEAPETASVPEAPDPLF